MMAAFFVDCLMIECCGAFDHEHGGMPGTLPASGLSVFALPVVRAADR